MFESDKTALLGLQGPDADEHEQSHITILCEEDNLSNNLDAFRENNGSYLHRNSAEGKEEEDSLLYSRSHSMDRKLTLALSWQDVNVSVLVPGKSAGCCRTQAVPHQEKHILRNVSGVVQPGNLLAIMGASGSGKSTLLNVLTRRNIRGYSLTGDIRLNGCQIGEGINNLSAYVQQDDLFISTLTVRELLQFRALLRMDKRLGKTARLARVEEVICEMGLSTCANSRIGEAGGNEKGISGGERKRLSFASEALTNPPIFFCDEPTSGLDTFMAQSIIHTLQKMASRGRTILCTIHQPSSELFAMFSQILLMAEGRTAFMGSRDEAIAFFERQQFPCPNNFNPADHFVLTLAIVPGSEADCRKKTHAICDEFSKGPKAASIEAEITALQEASCPKLDYQLLVESSGYSRYETSWLTQFRYLMWRSWISLFRNTALFKVRVMRSAVIALFMGLVYLRLSVSQKGVQNINGAIFLLITNASFSSIFAVVNSFPLEMGIFLREYGSRLYRVDVYFLSKTFAEVPVFVLTSIIFTTVTYWMIGLYAGFETYIIAVGVLFLVTNVAMSLGYLVSTLCGSISLSLTLVPPLLIPFMLFGGLFLNTNNIPAYFVWLEYLSWFKYSNEILLVNQWQNIDHIPCDNSSIPLNTTLPPIPGQRCAYRNGDDVINYFSYDADNVTVDIVMLAVLVFGFRFLSFLALLVRAKQSKV